MGRNARIREAEDRLKLIDPFIVDNPISEVGKDDGRTMPRLLDDLLTFATVVPSREELSIASLFVNMALRNRIKDAMRAEGCTDEQASRVINRLVGAPPGGYAKPDSKN